MTISTALTVPIRTHFPGAETPKTFDKTFRLPPVQPLRTCPYGYEPIPAYRSKVFSEFESSKGTLLNTWG